MFIFSKALDQLICGNFLKMNPITDSPGDLPEIKRNYVFVFLKTVFGTTRKCVKYSALGLTLKLSLRMTENESYKVNTNKIIYNADLGNLF